MTLCLKGDVPFMEHLLSIDDQLLGVKIVIIKLRPLIFQNNLPINDMLDDGIAVHLNFNSHPLVSVIRF